MYLRKKTTGMNRLDQTQLAVGTQAARRVGQGDWREATSVGRSNVSFPRELRVG